MGRMIDIVATTPRHVLAISQVEHTEHNARYRDNGKQEYLIPGIQKDGGKQDSRHRTRSPDRSIAADFTIAHNIGNRCSCHSPEIKQEERPTAKTQVGKDPLNVFPERPESEHIHKQMHPIGMNKSMGQQTVPFPVVHHPVRTQRQAVKQLPVLKTKERDYNRSNGDKGCQHIT